MRKSPFDAMVGTFAVLDRGFDAASIEGPNQNISIADIERLERLEALTQDTIDSVKTAVKAAEAGSVREARREIDKSLDWVEELVGEARR